MFLLKRVQLFTDSTRACVFFEYFSKPVYHYVEKCHVIDGLEAFSAYGNQKQLSSSVFFGRRNIGPMAVCRNFH